MTDNPDMLRFNGGPLDGQMAEWTGDWPPPAELIGYCGNTTGYWGVFAEGTPADKIEEAKTVADVATYRLRNASRMPDNFKSDHVFRGADYEVKQ